MKLEEIDKEVQDLYQGGKKELAHLRGIYLCLMELLRAHEESHVVNTITNAESMASSSNVGLNAGEDVRALEAGEKVREDLRSVNDGDVIDKRNTNDKRNHKSRKKRLVKR